MFYRQRKEILSPGTDSLPPVLGKFHVSYFALWGCLSHLLDCKVSLGNA